MKLINLFLMLSLTLSSSSCSSAEWKRCGVDPKIQSWEWCASSRHGEDKHHKGFCYVTRECKQRNWPLSDLKRNVILFCAFSDMQCIESNNLFNKRIISVE
jgi:hypothetical protein